MKEYTKNCTKKILMNWITTMVWSVTQNQTFWSVTSGGSKVALLLTKLMDAMGFQYSYLKPQRMMPSRCYIQHVHKSGRPSSGHRTGKVNPHTNSQGQ